ncbi:SAM-dependent methyltransferase [Cryptosporangium minutisporangium]|uniref:SAM-dependent methyltransferase n=1 Tax=Cryptosporangium minutisporangium TaxID=113569 RepID=A0ABP6TCB9_9ACTN
MDRPDWVSDTVDPDQPSAARMYDYYLGGSHNFASDREMARKALALFPDGQLAAQANRAFLHRGVRYLLDQGIRQFLDLGSGIPTAGNVHEVAPDATVVYVDLDPVAVAHSEAILADVDRAGIVHADIRRTQDVLDAPVTQRMLDFSQPIGLLTVAVLHFIGSDDEAADIVSTFRDALPTGSGLVLAHATMDGREEEMKRIEEIYKGSANPATTRSYAQVERFLAGWDLVEPGLTWAVQWKPDWPDEADRDPSWCGNYGAVGWKR